MKKKLQFIRQHPDARLPSKSTPQSAGFDLYPLHADTIPHGLQPTVIDTGIVVQGNRLDVAYFVMPRSGLWKKGLIVDPQMYGLSLIGTIDSDYTGTLKIGVRNVSGKPIQISQEDPIAQLVPILLAFTDAEEAGHVEATVRGARGGINED